MFRYIALIWNDADPAAGEAARQLAGRLRSQPLQWHATLDEPGLVVFASGERPGSSECYPLQGSAGVVLGKLFTRSTAGDSVSAPPAFDANESAKVVATAGRHLIDAYWGRYVAFLRDAASRTAWVLRDPTAALPCQVVAHGGVQVHFSSMEDGVQLGLGNFSVDWKYIAAALCYMRLQLNATALDGVSQVLGGECIEWRDGAAKSRFYWHPLRIAETDVFDDFAAAAQALRRTARDCVQAWAGSYRVILHTLSGGLDSSIVMACLQDAPSRPQITCINYHSAGSDTDERRFARLAAARAGVELIERERNPDVSFEPLLSMQRSSVPPTTVLYPLENVRSEAQLATERGATAIFSGNMGDQLFYQSRASFGASEYLGRHGLRRALLPIALDAARMDRLSIWTVLREALAEKFLRRHWRPSEDAGSYRQLLAAGVAEAAAGDPAFIHPLFRDTGRLPSGRLYHAYSLIFPPPDFHGPTGQPDDPEPVAPLYSQPLIEVLLRTPTYLLTYGGWDRATARRAFQHDMPREIVVRRTKGGMEEHAKGIFLRNIGLVSELLPKGFLVREGILDGRKLREVLSGGPTRIASGTVELYDYFAAEAWVRRWCGAPVLRAAA